MEPEQDAKIHMVMNQTNYTFEQAREKLAQFNNDELNTIRDYLGIQPKKTQSKSLNQQIYSQIRSKLDDSMKSYREKTQS